MFWLLIGLLIYAIGYISCLFACAFIDNREGTHYSDGNSKDNFLASIFWPIVLPGALFWILFGIKNLKGKTNFDLIMNWVISLFNKKENK